MAPSTVETEPAQAAPPVSNRVFHWTMGWLTLALIVFAAIALPAKGLILPLSAALSIPLAAVPCGLVAAYCIWTKNDRMREAALIVLWAGLLASLLEYPMYVASRFHYPLRDQWLSNIDHHIGVEVPTILAWVAHHPHIGGFLNTIYDVLILMMFAAAAVPGIAGKFTAAKEFVISTSFASIAVAPVSAVLPAIGPWVAYHFAPSQPQLETQQLLLALRDAAPHIIRSSDSGIICFPSFHVLLAILCCIALCSVRVLRIPVIILTVLIAISTITSGWHYFIDVLGGLVLTVLSVLAAKAYTLMEKRLEARS